jgi:hypothetical protein
LAEYCYCSETVLPKLHICIFFLKFVYWNIYRRTAHHINCGAVIKTEKLIMAQYCQLHYSFIQAFLFSPMNVLLQNPIQHTTLHLVIILSQSFPIYDSCLSWPWQFWGALVRYFVECHTSSVWCFLRIILKLWAAVFLELNNPLVFSSSLLAS